MSQLDRDKWNRRYREGAYGDRPYPSAFLGDWIERLPPGRALDVACGAGRNALFLAARGYRVDAVDISREGLQRGRERAQRLNLKVNWLEHDLDESVALQGGYQVILLLRYVNLKLLHELKSLLSAGGILLCEEHLETSEDVIGPGNSAFRVKTGELRAAAKGLEIIHWEEGLFTEPDGRLAALSRLVARKP